VGRILIGNVLNKKIINHFSNEIILCTNIYTHKLLINEYIDFPIQISHYILYVYLIHIIINDKMYCPEFWNVISYKESVTNVRINNCKSYYI